MRFNKIMMAAALVFGASSMAQAADQGHGTVTFQGAIIDAPCSIKPDKQDQTVPMGSISNVSLKNGQKSTPVPFTIDLENCDLGDTQNVSLTFTGMESAAGNGLLGLTGDAKGASLAITQGNGELIELGTATAPQILQDGNNTLNFSAYLQGDNASEAITPGEFQTVVDFTLAYQ